MSAREAARHTAATAPVRLTDGVLLAVHDRLCGVPPERGGALLACGPLVHLLVDDTHGRYTGASWDISTELSTAVGGLEQAGHGRLAGTVHTHPDGVPDPSGTDVRSTEKMLEINPHLSELLIAVVTAGRPRPSDLPVGTGFRMSLHVLTRGHGRRGELRRVPGKVVGLAADLATAGVELPSATSVRQRRRGGEGDDLPAVLHVDHRPRLAVPVPSHRTAALFVDAEHPAVGPLAVVRERGTDGAPGRPVPVPSPWDPTRPAAPQLAALARAAAGRRPDGAADRVWPLVGDLADRRVVVAGLGSVGSRIAEDLVRCGVGSLTLIDPETVEGPNLSRTVYTAADLGESKPAALARRLSAVDPAVRVVSHASALAELDLGEVLSGADLVIGATDDMNQQALLSHHAYAAGVPMVACALYRAAAAGEVVLSVPAADTACWHCAVGSATDTAALRPDRDYGLSGRLVGEAALGPSIHLVAGCASAAAVGLLAGPSSAAGKPLTRLLAGGRTVGIVATSPGWGFFPQVLPGLPHQHAPQSVWAVVHRSPQCPVCGPEDHRISPDTAKSRAADLTATLDSLREEAAALAAEGEQEAVPDSLPGGAGFPPGGGQPAAGGGGSVVPHAET